jgi:uridine kinase
VHAVTAAARTLITVDGLDGSGKSMLARRLAQALGARVALLAVDDFRRPVDWTRTDRDELDLYYDERYDLAALELCAAAFLAGAPSTSYVAFDGARETLGEQRALDLTGVDHLIVEGVFVARLPSAARAVSIYVDITEAEARRRIVARDTQKGRTLEEVTRRIDERYFPAHTRYQAAHHPRDRAHVLIDNHDVTAPGLLRAELPAGPINESLAIAMGEQNRRP